MGKKRRKRMTLREFMILLEKETRGVNPDKTNVEVLSTYWTQVQQSIISAPVTSIGMDENSGNLFIEINKTEIND
jgi:hypothetical protein